MSLGRKAAVSWCIPTIVFAGAVTATSPSVLAQAKPQYDVMPVYEKFTNAAREFTSDMSKEERAAIARDRSWKRQLELMVGNILRGSPDVTLQDEVTKKRFDNWYKYYYFAILTHSDHLSGWPDTRKKFLNSLTPSNVPGSVHDHLVELTLQIMQSIAKGNYHPAARYNAVHLIGSLNKSEAVLIGANKRLPVPSMKGLGIMLDEFADPNQIDAVRVAALVGIHRHTKLDRQLPAENRKLAAYNHRIVDLMVGQAGMKDPPEGRSQGGHDWMRRRAVEILGLLGSTGQNGKVVTALDTLVADATTPVSLKCSAAEALGRLNYAANANVNVAETAKKLGAVAVYACHKEVRRVEDQQAREQKEAELMGRRSAVGGMSSPGPMGGLSAGRLGAAFGAADVFDPLGYRIDLTRRRVKHQTLLVRNGLVGPKVDEKTRSRIGPVDPNAVEPEPEKRGLLAAATSDDDQAYIKDVVDGIDAIVAVVDSPEAGDLTSLVADIRNKVNDLEQNCEIVVDMGDAEGEAGGPDGLSADPMDALDLGAGMDLPSVPPAAAKPATKTPAKPAAKTPAKPAVSPPAEPPTNVPTKPAATAPAKPAATAPAKPEATAPAKPEATAPAKPEATAPAKPEATAPAKPEAKTPSKPTIPAPAVPPATSPATKKPGSKP